MIGGGLPGAKAASDCPETGEVIRCFLCFDRCIGLGTRTTSCPGHPKGTDRFMGHEGTRVPTL